MRTRVSGLVLFVIAVATGTAVAVEPTNMQQA
jgi:hypothetical protein